VLLFAACGGPETDSDSDSAAIRTAETTRTTPEARDRPEEPNRPERPDVIECRTDDACPRGSYCETGLNICFTSSRCIVDGRPSDRFCEATYGEGFVCFEYGAGSHHCVPTEPQRDPPEQLCRSTIDCRTDEACPRGSSCVPGLNYCLSPQRCIVNGRPSHRFCHATYGERSFCHEYGEDSWHCAPYTIDTCE
jgi:hypothetical protein